MYIMQHPLRLCTEIFISASLNLSQALTNLRNSCNGHTMFNFLVSFDPANKIVLVFHHSAPLFPYQYNLPVFGNVSNPM